MSRRESESPPGPSGSLGASGRWLAGAVLVPAVPLLLLSVVALAAFYAAPERFGAWLARLPGDTYLRTAMIFAPASLLAVVVLATLYLRDSAETDDGSGRIAGGLSRAGRLSLAVSGPLLALVGAIHAARYLDVERVDHWIEALPGTSYLNRTLDLAPLVLILAFGVGILLGFAPDERAVQAPAPSVPRRRWTRARLGRVAAGVVLSLATPAMLLSLLGLVLQVVAPSSLARLLEPLPGDIYLRLLLMLAPSGLLAVLLLALLYLLGPLDPDRTQPVRRQALESEIDGRIISAQVRSGSPSRPNLARARRFSQGFRSDLAMVVLVVGIVLAVAAGAVLIGGMLVLLLVR